MKSNIEIDSENPEELADAVKPSLESDEGVEIRVGTEEDFLKADVKAETLGRLRGGTDAVFRLTGIAKKILER